MNSFSKGREKRESKGGKPRNRLLSLENELMVTRGEVPGPGWGGVGGVGEWGKQVMGIKENTCYDEHRLLCGTVELLYGTPETNITLCNWNLNKT